MTTSPVMGITEELLAVLEAEANASLGENGTGFVERVTGFSLMDLVKEVRRLRSAIAQPPASAVPMGWKLVPVEPTPEMIERSQYWHRCREPQVPPENFRGFYDALLAAAPPATERDALRAEVERLERITRHLVRTYIVSDDAYSPEAETDKAISRIKAQFSAT